MVSWGAVLSVLIILMVPLSLGVAWLTHVYRLFTNEGVVA